MQHLTFQTVLDVAVLVAVAVDLLVGVRFFLRQEELELALDGLRQERKFAEGALELLDRRIREASEELRPTARRIPTPRPPAYRDANLTIPGIGRAP